jgi:hypothetical protein
VGGLLSAGDLGESEARLQLYSRAAGRLIRELIVLTPGGLEQFFRELAEAERNGTLGPDAYAAASEKAGISWL